MKSRILVVSIISVVFFSLQFISSCKKINEGTTIGDSLIPVVDNITTFDTTLAVQTYNGSFTDAEDSTRVTAAAEHFVGRITNDQLFGKTTASLFLQLKPAGFPYFFNDKADSITSMALDSVVLVLGYTDTYGDSNAIQKLNVYEMDQTCNFSADSIYLVRSNTFTYSNQLTTGAASIRPSDLNDSITPLEETTTANQLRIKLSNTFGQRLLNYDSTPGNAYHDDSTFDTFFKGFAVVPDPNNGNGVIGVNLLDSNTKLAIYFKRYKNNGATPSDTTVRYFRFIGTSAQANLVIREHAAGTIQNYLTNSPSAEDDLVFIQNTPGTYANVKIPGLGSLSNRLIHRAELIAEEVYDPSDATFPPPQYLYVDAYDSSLTGYRTIPLDFQIDLTGNVNSGPFGMVGIPTVFNGNTISAWHLNLTRYVQHIVTNHATSYDLRLFSPNYLKETYSADGSTQQININPTTTKGRVRLAGGNNATPQRMRLHIVYSKI